MNIDFGALGKSIGGFASTAAEATKGAFIKRTDLEKKLDEALSKANWGASGTLLAEIAQHTHNYGDYPVIMKAVWDCFGHDGKNWRQIYKGLCLLDSLVKNGSDRVVEDARNKKFQIKTLCDFEYRENGVDRGTGVREKASQLCTLLKDNNLIREEREKAKAIRSKIGSSLTSETVQNYRTNYKHDLSDSRLESSDQDSIKKKKKSKKKKKRGGKHEVSDNDSEDSEENSDNRYNNVGKKSVSESMDGKKKSRKSKKQKKSKKHREQQQQQNDVTDDLFFTSASTISATATAANAFATSSNGTGSDFFNDDWNVPNTNESDFFAAPTSSSIPTTTTTTNVESAGDFFTSNVNPSTVMSASPAAVSNGGDNAFDFFEAPSTSVSDSTQIHNQIQNNSNDVADIFSSSANNNVGAPASVPDVFGSFASATPVYGGTTKSGVPSMVPTAAAPKAASTTDNSVFESLVSLDSLSLNSSKPKTIPPTSNAGPSQYYAGSHSNASGVYSSTASTSYPSGNPYAMHNNIPAVANGIGYYNGGHMNNMNGFSNNIPSSNPYAHHNNASMFLPSNAHNNNNGNFTSTSNNNGFPF